MNSILVPPLAFVLYLVLVQLLILMGRLLAGTARPTPLKSSIYTGGEALATGTNAPGYHNYFVIALFFAVLHLGALILGIANAPQLIVMLYAVGLIIVLIALLLG
jgi:NADH:ubiquinone oxidoreductase subunit 3 (subunit A)